MQPQQPQSRNLRMRFNVNIRREARQKIMRDQRNFQMFDSRPIQQIVSIWSLPSNVDKYTVHFIVSHRYEELLQIPLKYGRNKKYQFEGQDCAIRGMDDHIIFWSFFLQEVFLNKETFSVTMISFLEDLVNKYQYKELTVCKPLQFKVINVLELSARAAQSTKHYREALLHWVAGPQGINIIYQSIFSTFLPYCQYPTVYEVMRNTLSMKRKSQTQIVCLIIKEMMRTADEDDIYEIYQHFPDLGLKLMEEGVRYVEDADISYIADSILLLIDSFVQVKIDYMRGGLGYMATRMIISRNQPNILKALQILCWVTESGAKEIIQYLANDRQLNDAGLWKYLLQGGDVYIHRNFNIKKKGFQLLRNIICCGEYQQIVFITSNFDAHYAENFMHFIQLALRQQNDSEILEFMLQILSVLLFYGQNHRSQDDKNLPLEMCMHMNLGREIENLAQNMNESVREKAEDVLRAFESSEFKQESNFH